MRPCPVASISYHIHRHSFVEPLIHQNLRRESVGKKIGFIKIFEIPYDLGRRSGCDGGGVVHNDIRHVEFGTPKSDQFLKCRWS